MNNLDVNLVQQIMAKPPPTNRHWTVLKEYIVGANSEINRLKIEMSVLSIQLNEREE
jgi:hypothetical protein